jgi:hypothetical protein
LDRPNIASDATGAPFLSWITATSFVPFARDRRRPHSTLGRGAPPRFSRRALCIEPIVDHRYEAREQLPNIVRAGTCLGMTLKTEGRTVGSFDSLQRSVE